MDPRTPSLPDAALRRRVAAAAAGIIALVLLAYANTLRVPLLFDDHAAIAENTWQRAPGDWRALFRPPASSPTAGRPLLNLSFALNHAVGGTDVRGYHVFNLAIHVAAALVLFGLVRRTLLLLDKWPRVREASLPIAAVAAATWAVHPVVTGAVTYLSQRAESLMGLCYFFTLYGLARAAGGGSRRWLGLAIAACFAGMATKEVMVTAPVLVLAYDRVFVSGSWADAWRTRRGFYLALGASWGLLALLVAGAQLAERNVGFGQGVTPWAYALTEARVIIAYLQLAVWPNPLVFDRGVELLREPLARALPAVVLLGAMGWGVFKVWRWNAALGFGLLAFFVVLAPTSSFVPIAEQPMAASRLYVPLAALVTVLVTLVSAAGGRRALVGAALAVLAAVMVSRARNDDYRSAIALWTDTVAKAPQSCRAHHSLANELARDPRRAAEAGKHYEAALAINPQHPDVHCDFATWLEQQPEGYAAAREHYETALRHDPRHARAHHNLAVLLARDPAARAAAVFHAREAVRCSPEYPEAHYNLGTLLLADPRHTAEAVRHLRVAVRLRPGHAEAHNNLGNALAGRPDRVGEALAHLETAVRLKPDFAEAHNNLGSLLTRLPERRAEAVTHFRAAVQRAPAFAEAHCNLARELAAQPGGAAEASVHYRAALSARPDMAVAHNGLAEILFKRGALEDAIRELETALQLDPGYADARHNLETLRSLQRAR